MARSTGGATDTPIYGQFIDIVLLSWGCLVRPVMMSIRKPEIKQYLAQVDWLPNTVSDINYWRIKAGGSLKYECYMSEPDFHQDGS